MGKEKKLISNSLKTFSSSWRGSHNVEMDKIMNEFKDECQPIIDKYINKFARGNLEYYSINGALHEEFESMILTARIQTLLDLAEEGIILE